MASTPRSWASRRMLRPSMPLSSASATAAPRTRSRLSGAREFGSGCVCVILRLTALQRTSMVHGWTYTVRKGTTNMKAVRHIGYGDPATAIAIGEAEKPVATGKQALVRVVASSINAGDWRAVYASPWWLRLIAGYRRPRDPAL